MCGFSGFAGNNCKKEDVLKRMTAKIAHRGPDQEGVFLSEKAALGFRRLSIIDLNNGSQPMYNEDGKIVITLTLDLAHSRCITRITILLLHLTARFIIIWN